MAIQMVTKYKIIKAFIIITLLVYIGIFTSSVYAEDTQATSIALQSEKETEENTGKLIHKSVEDQINDIHSLIDSQEEKSEQKIQYFQTLISFQEEKIKSLSLELKLLSSTPITNGTTFEVWSGILLACVAIMITVLSVMLAFFQYSGLKNAKEESIREARKIANQITPEVAKEELKKHIDNGSFNSTIIEAVEKVTYGSIIANPDFEYEEESPDDEA